MGSCLACSPDGDAMWRAIYQAPGEHIRQRWSRQLCDAGSEPPTMGRQPFRSSDPDVQAITLPVEGQDSHKRRRSCNAMMEHINNLQELEVAKPSEVPVTLANAKKNLLVMRGPNWKWGDEDGGAGHLGTLLAIDEATGLATVHWHDSCIVRSHYRVKGAAAELCLTQEEVVALRKTSLSSTDSEDAGPRRPRGQPCYSSKRNSQGGFADKMQTIIILDWDDTLFPSSYLRGDLGLPLRMPLKARNISESMRRKVCAHISGVAHRAEQLLRLAKQMCGKVIVVTLARSPWVDDATDFFFPSLSKVLEELQIKVVYAQDGVKTRAPDSGPAAEFYWSKLKGEAIGREVSEFYTQYEGQSWKNIISIGDSDFERRGTIQAAEDYMKQRGILTGKCEKNERTGDSGKFALLSDPGSPKVAQAEVQGHFYRVRSKTFKLVDQPTAGELIAQLDMLQKWLPLMVNIDDGLDVEFSSLTDIREIEAIDAKLRGESS